MHQASIQIITPTRLAEKIKPNGNKYKYQYQK